MTVVKPAPFDKSPSRISALRDAKSVWVGRWPRAWYRPSQPLVMCQCWLPAHPLLPQSEVQQHQPSHPAQSQAHRKLLQEAAGRRLQQRKVNHHLKSGVQGQTQAGVGQGCPQGGGGNHRARSLQQVFMTHPCLMYHVDLYHQVWIWVKHWGALGHCREDATLTLKSPCMHSSLVLPSKEGCTSTKSLFYTRCAAAV